MAKPSLPLPAHEGEVIDRLKITPDSVDVSIRKTKDQRVRPPNTKLTYEYNGPLPRLGTFLHDIAHDIYQAGGVVVRFNLGSTLFGVEPAGRTKDQFHPDQPWEAASVVAHIRTQHRVNEDAAQADRDATAFAEYLQRQYGPKKK